MKDYIQTECMPEISRSSDDNVFYERIKALPREGDEFHTPTKRFLVVKVIVCSGQFADAKLLLRRLT